MLHLLQDCLNNEYTMYNYSSYFRWKKPFEINSPTNTYCLPILNTANQKAFAWFIKSFWIKQKTLQGKQITLLSKDISRFPHACIQYLKNRKRQCTRHTLSIYRTLAQKMALWELQRLPKIVTGKLFYCGKYPSRNDARTLNQPQNIETHCHNVDLNFTSN